MDLCCMDELYFNDNVYDGVMKNIKDAYPSHYKSLRHLCDVIEKTYDNDVNANLNLIRTSIIAYVEKFGLDMDVVVGRVYPKMYTLEFPLSKDAAITVDVGISDFNPNIILNVPTAQALEIANRIAAKYESVLSFTNVKVADAEDESVVKVFITNFYDSVITDEKYMRDEDAKNYVTYNDKSINNIQSSVVLITNADKLLENLSDVGKAQFEEVVGKAKNVGWSIILQTEEPDKLGEFAYQFAVIKSDSESIQIPTVGTFTVAE